MDRRPGPAPAITLVWLLLGGVAPAHASLLIDFDSSRLLWSNDGSPVIEGRHGGESRQLRSDPVVAAPLTPTGSLRFPLCRLLPEGAPDHCTGTPLPAGETPLELTMPLPIHLRQAYLPLWQLAEPEVPPEQLALTEAMGQVGRDLSAAIQFRELPRVLVPLQQAARQAEAAAVDPPLVARARRAERMAEVFADLWRIRNALASRDLSLPCDTLEEKAELFNQAAGEPVVRLRRQRPRGICLFCANVCTPESADELLAAMKESLIRLLGEGVALPPPAAGR